MTIAAIAAALIGPLIAYVVASRKMSGKIATSEASDLWAASTALRTEYKEEVGTLRLIVNKHEHTIKELREEVAQLKDKNKELKELSDKLCREVEMQAKTIASLETELANRSA